MDLDDDTPHLEERIVMALKTVYDPEIPVDIYELGLDLRHRHHAGERRDRAHDADLALLPRGGADPPEVEQKVASVAGVTQREGRDRLGADVDQGHDVRRSRRSCGWGSSNLFPGPEPQSYASSYAARAQKEGAEMAT